MLKSKSVNVSDERAGGAQCETVSPTLPIRSALESPVTSD